MYRIWAIVVVAGLPLTACGSGDPSSGVPATEPAAAVPTTLATAVTSPSDEPIADGQCQPARPHTPGVAEFAMMSSGVERTYLVHIPDQYLGSSAWPVIVALHGKDWNARDWFRSTWQAAATDLDSLLVLPEAAGLDWADRSFEPDVPFIMDVLTEVEATFCVDSTRIYASGASDGADMVTRLACEAGDRFAAMRPYVGMHYPQLFETEACDQPGPVPMTSYIGTDEPFYDLEVIFEGLAMWAERNGCQGEPDTEEVAGGATVTRYDNCSQHATVELHLLDGVEHEAAQIECDGNDPGFCRTHTYDTTGTMLRFFNEHST